MSPDVRTVGAPAADDLRRLIADVLDRIVDRPYLLDAGLPWAGGPLLVVDGQQQPVLISFDVNDACRALFNGLEALDRFESGHALLTRLHHRLAESPVSGTPRLVILVGNATPALRRLGGLMPQIEIMTFRVLEVDGRPGLLIESLTDPPARGAGVEPLLEQPPAPQGGLPGSGWDIELTEQENAYFRRLKGECP